MKSSRAQHLTPRRIQLLVLLGLLAHTDAAFCGGIITNCTQADLQAALVGGGAVTFACSGTITLTNTLSITQDTTIDASGYQVKISGGNAVRLFTVTNAAFRASGLTLADGRFIGADGTNTTYPSPGQGGTGACILNQGGTVSLISCTLTNHSAQGGNAGPAFFGDPIGPAGVGLGGAIYSAGGQINLTNCLVVGCTATGGVGGGYYPDYPGWSGVGFGGAFYLAGSGLNLQDVTLVNNRAIGGGGRYLYSFAAGADACGGAIYATGSSLWASNSVLYGNAATGGAFTALPN